MAFRGEMHNCVRLLSFQQLPDKTAVANIPLNELIPPVRCHAFQILEIPRICQFVQIQDRRGFIVNLLQHKIGPYEAGSPRNQNRISHGMNVVRGRAAAQLAARG